MLTADCHMLVHLNEIVQKAWVKRLRYSPKRTSLSPGERVRVMQWINPLSGPVSHKSWFARWCDISGKVNYVTPDTLLYARDVLSAGKYTYFSLLRLRRQHCSVLSWKSDLATGLLDRSTPTTGKQKYLCLYCFKCLILEVCMKHTLCMLLRLNCLFRFNPQIKSRELWRAFSPVWPLEQCCSKLQGPNSCFSVDKD